MYSVRVYFGALYVNTLRATGNQTHISCVFKHTWQKSDSDYLYFFQINLTTLQFLLVPLVVEVPLFCYFVHLPAYHCLDKKHKPGCVRTYCTVYSFLYFIIKATSYVNHKVV